MLLDTAFEQAHARLASLDEDIRADTTLPHLANAVVHLSRRERLRGVRRVIPLLDRKWTLQHLEEAIIRHRGEYLHHGAERTPAHILDALHLLAFLPPSELDIWLQTADNRLMPLADAGVIETIHAWRTVAPGALAPLAVLAGLSLSEAEDGYRSGRLTEASLRALITLRRER